MTTSKGQGQTDRRRPTGPSSESRRATSSGPVRRFSRTWPRGSEEHLRCALVAAGVAAWDIDLTTRSVLWSAGVEALLGLGDEFRGTYRRYLRTVVREDRRGLVNAVRRALRSEGRLSHQHRIVRGDGSLRHVAIVASLSGNLKGRPSRVAGVAMDVTDRERANSRLRLQLGQAQRMEAVAQLAGGIAHDFNNALMAIIGNVDMALGHLAQGGEASGEVTTALREIGDSARHASKLAARLLAFARRRRQ